MAPALMEWATAGPGPTRPISEVAHWDFRRRGGHHKRGPMITDSTRAKASVLVDFVDTLIPGNEIWPSASMIGVQGVLAARLLDLNGEGSVEGLITTLEKCGGPFTGKVDEERIGIVERFECEHPSLFALVREAA